MREVLPKSLSNEIKIVLQCINNIPPSYYMEQATVLKAGQIVTTNTKRTNESAFVSQLFASTQQAFHSRQLHRDRLFQTNPTKKLILDSEHYETKYRSSFEQLFRLEQREHKEFYTVPDMIIHEGPEDMKIPNQIFISEVKTTLRLSQQRFNVDLFKVNVYHEELWFQNSAFIIVNQKLEAVERKIRTYRDQNLFRSIRKGLYIIVKENSSNKNPAKVFAQ